jgi:hypothetical protein
MSPPRPHYCCVPVVRIMPGGLSRVANCGNLANVKTKDGYICEPHRLEKAKRECSGQETSK